MWVTKQGKSSVPIKIRWKSSNSATHKLACESGANSYSPPNINAPCVTLTLQRPLSNILLLLGVSYSLGLYEVVTGTCKPDKFGVWHAPYYTTWRRTKCFQQALEMILVWTSKTAVFWQIYIITCNFKMQQSTGSAEYETLSEWKEQIGLKLEWNDWLSHGR